MNLKPFANSSGKRYALIGAVLAQEPTQPPQPPLLVDNAACLDADGIPNFDVPNLSANCPDLFAWLKFIEINAPAPDHPDLALWQTWATDPDTFPEKPQPLECSDPASDDPERCPVWPERQPNPTECGAAPLA
jgi:hypothetical protein